MASSAKPISTSTPKNTAPKSSPTYRSFSSLRDQSNLIPHKILSCSQVICRASLLRRAALFTVVTRCPACSWLRLVSSISVVRSPHAELPAPYRHHNHHHRYSDPCPFLRPSFR